MDVGASGGQVVLLLRCLRTGPTDWLAAGGLMRNEERLEEAADASGPVITRLDGGRVDDAGARASRFEEEAEGTCEVGAVEPCVADARCEVVGRVEVCVMVVLWSILPGGGRAT